MAVDLLHWNSLSDPNALWGTYSAARLTSIDSQTCGTGTDDQTAKAELIMSNIDSLSASPTSINSITFRVHNWFSSWSDDTSTYRFTLYIASDTYTIDVNAATIGSTPTTQTVSLPTTYTQAQIEAATFGLVHLTWSRSMGSDGSWLNTDLAELEVDYSTSAPRNVTCTTESVSLTENQATVSMGTPRNVTCSTEVVSLTENAALVATDTRTVVAAPKELKRYKGLDFQTVTFDASEWRNPGATGTYGTDNAFDGSIATSQLVRIDNASDASLLQAGQGISTKLGPISSATDVPLRIEMRAYISGTSRIDFFAGFENGENYDFTVGGEWWKSRGLPRMFHASSATPAWTDWYPVAAGIWNWDDPYTQNATTPLTWDAINNELTIAFDAPDGPSPYVHAIELRITSGPADCIRVGHFDGSNGATTQTGSGWTDLTNIEDGSTSTWTYKDTASASALEVRGNNLTLGTASSGEVLQVYYRARLRLSDPVPPDPEFQYCGGIIGITTPNVAYGINIEMARDSILQANTGNETGWTTSGFSFLNIEGSSLTAHPITQNATAFWSPWIALDMADPLWVEGDGTDYRDWDNISKLKATAQIYSGYFVDNAEFAVAEIEIAAMVAPSNSNRRGSLTKFNRSISGSTEAITSTANQATVTINIPRDVLCTTEVVTLTESAATIEFISFRNVLGVTEALAFTEQTATVDAVRQVTCSTEALALTESQATVHAFVDLNVNCTTEVLSLADNDSTVNLARGVSSATEALSLTEQGATINASRVTAGVTELLSLAESGASVDAARGVISGTESVAISENQSAINRERNVNSNTEALALTESQASVGTSENRDVTCSTEALTFTETPAAVNGTRVAAGTVEILAVVESASAVNAERSVLAPTETLTLADNDATVSFDRTVVATTEAISVAEEPATTNRQRGVNAGTEALSLSENPATANTSRSVQCATETCALAENQATLNLQRSVTATTEALAITENPATATLSRGVNAGTEAVVLAESIAQVFAGANLVVNCSTEGLTLDEAAASVLTDRGVAAGTEVLSLADNDATVARDRAFTTASESVVMTESQAIVDTSTSNNPRNVTCTTEAMSFVESAANVNGKRIAAAAAELVVLVEAPAGINRTLGIATAIETLSLAETAASVSASRVVAGDTEQLTVTESSATVSTSTNRVISANTSEVLVQETNAGVNRTRNTVAATDFLELLESDAAILIERSVSSVTETTALTASPATINLGRGVASQSAAAIVNSLVAAVFRGANRDVTASTSALLFEEQVVGISFPRHVRHAWAVDLVLTESHATVNRPWLLSCSTEELSLTESLAKITKSRTGAMPGSMVWVHPDIKPIWVSD